MNLYLKHFNAFTVFFFFFCQISFSAIHKFPPRVSNVRVWSYLSYPLSSGTSRKGLNGIYRTAVIGQGRLLSKQGLLSQFEQKLVMRRTPKLNGKNILSAANETLKVRGQ